MSLEFILLGLVLLATGALAGVLAGLLGIGGGLVFVPALVFLFHHLRIDPSVATHIAVGTSLAAIVLTSLSSIRAHARLQNIEWPLFRQLLPGLLVGGILGAVLASLLSGFGLRAFFAVFLIAVALQMFRGTVARQPCSMPGRRVNMASGVGIGTLSALLGIGGGTLTVPYLVWSSVPVLRAIGTAAAAGLPLAAAGAAGFVIVGWSVEALPAWQAGFVWWPGALVLGLTAMGFAPAGARLAHRIDPGQLRKGFAVVLLLVAVSLVW